MRAAGTRLLSRAQAVGIARTDIDGTDLFALIGALAWLSDQPVLTPRADHLFSVIASAILTPRASSDVERNTAVGQAAEIREPLHDPGQSSRHPEQL
jgi:hypothetical protein